MKLANVTSHFGKSNYWPVNILPNLPKVFERCLHKQISRFFNNIFFISLMRFSENPWRTALLPGLPS